MTPLYFGSSSRRLLGLYESARSPSRRTKAILFCHAWGTDYINSYRAIRFAASRFVAAGFCALRFDYYGSGDSDGDSADADLSGWEGDIETAMDELRELTQSKSIALFGLRVGATLAARVAARAPEAVSRLILFDPIVDGADYVEALAARKRRQRRDVNSTSSNTPAPAGPSELDGMRVSPAFVSALRAIDLAAPPAILCARTLVVSTVAHRRMSEARAAGPPTLGSRGTAALASHAPAPWANDPETGSVLPIHAVEQIIEWMG